MGVLLVAATRQCKYETPSELLNEYPEFTPHDELERVLLLENANMMYAALSFINPMQNKGVLLSIVPRLTEGCHVKYVTGGGSSKATLDRVAIFEREGKCSVRRRNCGGSARSKRSRSGHDLSYRRQLVRARLTTQGRVVTNAELMRLARTSLDNEGVDAFADLFDIYGNLKPFASPVGSAAYSDAFSAGAGAAAGAEAGAGVSSAAWNENKVLAGEGAKGNATSPSIDRTDESVSTISSPRFVVAPAAPAAAAAAVDAPKAGTKAKGKGKGKKGAAAEDGDSDNDRSSSSSSIYAETEALDGEYEDEQGFSMQLKKRGANRPPSFFGIDGSDGHPVAPLGAQAAVHLRLRCTTTPGNNGNNKVKLDNVWRGLSSMLALAETGDLTAPHAQLAKHPSEVVDSMLEDLMLPMPPPKVKAPTRPDAYASDFVYSTGTSSSGSSSRPRAGWRQGMDDEDAEVSMLLKEAGAKRPAKAQTRPPANKAARPATPLGDANAAELLLNIALGLTG